MVINQLDENTFNVTLSKKTTTAHQVTVPDEYYQELTGGSASKKDLIEASFEFLLEREDNTSILSKFELSEIESYFPEYDEAMKIKFSS